MVNWLHGIAVWLDTEVPEISFAADDVVNSAGQRVNMFVDKRMPPEPDTVFRLIGTGGDITARNVAVDRPSFQILARFDAGDSGTARLVCESIMDALFSLSHVTLSDGTWVALVSGLQSEPLYLGDDDNGRSEWSLNFSASIQRPNAIVSRS